MISRLTLPLAALLTVPALAQIPAFPGAEGFGAYSNGGRGGDVYYVTTLNNNGAGSLREGLNTAPASGRTIIFAVSGYIPVVSDTNFNVPSNVTIAGQTAPGDGVGLKGGRMLISGSNVVMRHFRIRHGKYGTGGDCLNIASSASSTMLDHISMMFSTDENFSFFNSSVNNFTMQYSNSTWGMERHNAGGLWDLQNGSCHHTLWAHHRTRNPKARPGGVLEWINNVTFHWRNEGFIMGDSETPANWKANVRGCYYISIDDADDGSTVRSTSLTKARVASNGVPNFTLYLDDTLYDYDDDGILDGTDRGYAIVSGSEFTPGDAVGSNRYYKSATPLPGATGLATVTIDDPLTAYKKVLSAGSPLRLDANYGGPIRDELDSLLNDTVVNQYSILVQKDGIIAGEDPTRTSNGEQLLADQYGITNNGFGTLNGTTPPSDADLDGMPDQWEIALNGKNGISYNPVGADNNNVFTAGQLPNTFFPSGTPTGYTFLEEYLHFKAIPHASMAKNTTAIASVQSIDLAKFTDGFTSSPVYTISNVRNGTVQQFAANGVTPMANGPIAKFTPTLDFTGRAGFDFNVTDADGSSWTQQCAILVTNSAAPRDLVWTAQSSGTWDTSTTNWENSGGADTVFNDGDSPLFDDRGTTTNVNLNGSRLVTSATVTGTKSYQLSGDALAATSTFTKASDTTLTLNTTVSAGTGTYLNGGNTIINTGGNISGGPVKFTGGSTLTDNTGSNYFTFTPNIEVSTGAVGNVNFSDRCDFNGSLSGGGTFNIFSPSALGTEGRVYFNGASAGCTGNVNLSGGGSGRIAFITNGGSFNGFGSARVNLDGISIFTRNNSGGNTYGIGSLSGTANAHIVGPYYAGSATWNVGGLGLDSEFAGVISNGPTGLQNHLNKYGSGVLTLSGANTYTGTTAIYGGELRVTGSLGATDNYVGGGATLSGTGQVAALLTAQNGSTVSPGDNPGEAGTMNLTNGIDLKAATMKFDLSGSTASGNDQILNSAGILTFRNDGGGSANFQFNLTDGYLSSGTYTLISGGAGTSAPGSPAFTHNLPANTRQAFSLQRSGGGSTTPGYVRLVVTGTSADLTWTGFGNNWTFLGTDWSGPSYPENRFYNLDRVHFTDTAIGAGSVNLLDTFQPQLVDVSANSKNFTFGGTGSIAGTGYLSKSGNGTLTLANTTANTYSGGTLISGGSLVLGNTTVGLGSGLVEMSGGTLQLPNAATFLDNSFLITGNCAIVSPYTGNSTIVDDYAETLASTGFPTVDLSGVAGFLSIKGGMDGFSGTLDLGSSSGTLRLNSGSDPNTDVNTGSPAAHFALGTANATLTNRNGDQEIDLGALSGGSGTHLNGRQTGTGNTSTTYRIGALDLDTCFDGTISHGGDLLGLDIIKVGTGRQCFGGTSNFIGTIAVESGTLATPGSVTITGAATVAPGATLDLDGGLLGAESVHVSAGASMTGPGTINGELTNDGLLTCTSGTLTLNGPVTNNGIARLTSGAVLSAGDEFLNNGILDLLTADGEVPANLINSGTVIDSSGLELDSFGISGSNFTVSLMTYEGHNYQLEWSPDMSPGSWTLLGSPIAGDGTVKPFTHTGGVGATPKFYRVVVTP